MSQFVEVGNSNLAEKCVPPAICCSSQGIEKEGDPRHFVRLSRWSVQPSFQKSVGRDRRSHFHRLDKPS